VDIYLVPLSASALKKKRHNKQKLFGMKEKRVIERKQLTYRTTASPSCMGLTKGYFWMDAMEILSLQKWL